MAADIAVLRHRRDFQLDLQFMPSAVIVKPLTFAYENASALVGSQATFSSSPWRPIRGEWAMPASNAKILDAASM